MGVVAGLRRQRYASSAPQRRRLRSVSSSARSAFTQGTVERLVVAASSAMQALSDPTNAGAVARFGEATGDHALRRIYHQMLQDPVGSRLLRDKPRINTTSLPVGCVCDKAVACSTVPHLLMLCCFIP
jgi:hypothetical protein|eukprot:COSAG02_NODE_537_length_20638_cov_49.009738_3_plen_128_part_00